MAKRIVILVEGGLIQWILADSDIEIMHIDADVQDAPEDDNRVVTLRDIDDEAFDAEAGIYQHDVAPKTVAMYFDQLEAIENERSTDG